MQQRFQVPQYIDIEDKILGPLTTRQFILMLTDAILSFVFYKLFDFSLFLTLTVLFFLIFMTFAFIKINGNHFHFFVLNVIETLKKPRTRVWNNAIEQIPAEDFKIVVKKDQYIYNPPKPLHKSRLAELSLTVDTTGEYKDN